MSLYYLILWNQVDILQKHFKKDMSIYAPLDEVLGMNVEVYLKIFTKTLKTSCMEQPELTAA